MTKKSKITAHKHKGFGFITDPKNKKRKKVIKYEVQIWNEYTLRWVHFITTTHFRIAKSLAEELGTLVEIEEV